MNMSRIGHRLTGLAVAGMVLAAGGTAFASGTGGGGAGMGGAVFANGGTLTLTNMTFTGNVDSNEVGRTVYQTMQTTARQIRAAQR